MSQPIGTFLRSSATCPVLPSNKFTGHWDIGHRLQLVYADILKKSPDLSKFLKIVNTDTSYCQGRDGLLLHELAMEMSKEANTTTNQYF